jgi:hypothetical protein
MNLIRALLFLLVITSPIFAADPADAIYHGGDVVTIDDKNPTAEAVAIKGGKIVAGEHPSAKEDRLFAAKLSAIKPGDRP